MTKKETALIIAMLRATYPKIYEGLTKEDISITVNVWYNSFKDIDYQTVLDGTMQFINITKSKELYGTVTPGDIHEQIYQMQHPDELSAEDAWSLVQRASSNGIYNATEEFNALPRAVQRAIGTPAQLRAWAVVDPQEFETVVASNFRRAYETMVRRSHELDALPAGAKEVMTAISGAVFKTLPEGRIDE